MSRPHLKFWGGPSPQPPKSRSMCRLLLLYPSPYLPPVFLPLLLKFALSPFLISKCWKLRPTWRIIKIIIIRPTWPIGVWIHQCDWQRMSAISEARGVHPPRQWCIPLLFQTSPAVSEKNFRLRGKFCKCYLFQRNFPFSSAKISDDFFIVIN